MVCLFIKEEFLESSCPYIDGEAICGQRMGGISQCRKTRYKKIRPGDGEWVKAKDNTHSQIQ